MSANYAQADHGSQQHSSGLLQQPSAEQSAAPTASAALMLMVAGLFAGSALISLSLLWLALRGVQWLVQG